MVTVSQAKCPVAGRHLTDQRDVQVPRPGGLALDGEPHGVIADRDTAPREPDPFGENGRCADLPIVRRDDRQEHDLEFVKLQQAPMGKVTSAFSHFLSMVIPAAADCGHCTLLPVCAGARRNPVTRPGHSD
jgi:hypothetical protein